MSKLKDTFEVLEILKKELPQCFKRGHDKLPLALGIHKELIKHYSQDPRFSNLMLRRAFYYYCHGEAYLKNIKEGMLRINLKGEKVSKVTVLEQSYALTQLKKRQAKALEKIP